MNSYLLVGLLAFSFTFLLTPIVRRLALGFAVLTPVRERDVHTVPTPRLGGVAMMVAMLGTLLLAGQMPYFSNLFHSLAPWALIGGGIGISLLGAIDDLYDLPWWSKLIGQFAISALTVWGGIRFVSLPIYGLTIASFRLSFLLSVLIMVVTMNAINFVDGLDGLAAGLVGIGASAFFAYSYILIRLTGAQSYATFAALIATVLVGICLGFLTSNFHPASIFMGDSGALLLGFLMSAAFIMVTGQVDPSVLGARSDYSFFLILLPIIVILLPLLDMLLAVFRRLKAGKSPFHPDRKHLHHRLLKLGGSHRQVVLVLYIWALLASASGVSFLVLPFKWVLGATTVGMVVAFTCTYLLKKQKNGKE